MGDNSYPSMEDRKKDMGFWIKQLDNGMEQQCNRRMAPLDITASQMEVLTFLHMHEDKEIHQIDVERHLHCSNPTITGIVQRLEAKGYVERIADQKDKRFKQLKLTEKSTQAFSKMDQNRRESERILWEGFSEDERTQLLGYLQRIYQNLLSEEGE